MTAACVVVGAVAGAAFANGEALEFRISNELSPSQPRATVEVWARFDPADYALAGTAFTVRGGEPGWIPGTLGVLGSGFGISSGRIAGADVVGIIGGQLHFPPPIIADPSNPIWVWSADFAATGFTPRSISLQTDTVKFDVYSSSSSPVSVSRLGALTGGAGEILVIPAPGAQIALVGAGLVALRRRVR